MTRGKAGLSGTNGKRSLGLIAVMLLVGLLLAALTTAPAGAGGSSATAAKKKKKTCPAGTQKVTVKKHGKKKKKCVALPVAAPPVATAAKLTIDQASFNYPDMHHGGLVTSDHAFTVTNSGQAASGTLTTSITVGTNPSDPNPGFTVGPGDTCNGVALAVGGSCIVTVRLTYHSEGAYTGTLHVVGTPGGDAQSVLSGTSTG